MSTTIPERIGFDATLSLDDLLIKAPDCHAIDAATQARLAHLFNKYGFLVLEHDETDDPMDQLRGLGKFFGSVYRHDRADEDGVVPITQIEGKDGYVGASNGPHPFHTDSAYEENPSRVLCLQCEVPSRIGGVSMAVSAKSIADHVIATDPKLVAELYAPDGLHVKRVGLEGTTALFAVKDGRTRVVWRDDETSDFAPRPTMDRLVAIIREFLADDTNVVTFSLQRNQILIGDNWGVVHGRTGFPESERRKLNRINFNGDGAWAERNLRFGFVS